MQMSQMKVPVLAVLSLLLAGSPAISAEADSANKFGFGTDSQGQARPRAAGWVYRNCASISTTLVGTGFVVKIVNSDSSWASAASKTSAPTVAQLMLLRACRETGAYWGLYTTGTSWSSAVGY